MLNILGLFLAIAAALDFAVKASYKAKVAAIFTVHAQSLAPVQHGGYRAIQRIFGPRFFSTRAIVLSVLISLISLAVSYLYAILTSDWDLVWIFERGASASAIVLFIVFLMGSVAGDVISYAQTRLFLRTIDQYRTGVITLGLAFADAVISLSLFILIFSFTRMAAYLVIIGGMSGAQLTSTQAINIDQLRDRLPAIVDEGLVRGSEVEWLMFLASAKSAEDESLIDETLRAYNERVVGPFGNSGEFEFSAQIECAPLEALSLMTRDSTEMLAKSIAGSRGFGQIDPEYANIYKDVLAHMVAWEPDVGTRSECSSRVLIINRKMSPDRLLSIAGPLNAWWASFQMTFEGAYNSIAYKFGPYVSINPYGDIGEYYQSIIFQSGYSFFDLTQADPTIPYLLSEFTYKVPDDAETLKVPYSPMLGSALAISVLFWLYVAVIYLSRGFTLLARIGAKLYERFDVARAPFTSLVLVLAAGVGALQALAWSANALWRSVF